MGIETCLLQRENEELKWINMNKITEVGVWHLVSTIEVSAVIVIIFSHTNVLTARYKNKTKWQPLRRSIR